MYKLVDETAIEYKIFLETFFYLKLSGYWQPTTLKHRCLQLCYSVHTVFASVVFCWMIVGSLIDMVLRRHEGYSHILENWCLTALVAHTLYNCLNFLVKRREVIDLLRTKLLVERWAILRDAEEVRIIETSKKKEVNVFRYWMSIIIFNSIMHGLPPIVGDNPNKVLLWDSWLPCDKDEPSCFWICYTHQFISYSIASLAHVAVGTIILNIMERICSHIRILQHRLTLLPELVQSGALTTADEELFYLNECVLDHQNIFSTAEDVNRIFSTVIFWHFLLMTSILCTNIYLLASKSIYSLQFLAGTTFLICVMSQFFFFCWLGDKIVNVSNDVSYTIFSINWLSLRKETRKRLRFIMLIASKGIPLFNNFIVELSPEMFLKLVKMSYSAFNLLQTQN